MNQDVPYKPIACHLYDYIEAVCVHRYEVCLTLTRGSSCQGVATDVVTENKQEYLVLKTHSDISKIRLDSIQTLQVISRPAVINRVDFTDSID